MTQIKIDSYEGIDCGKGLFPTKDYLSFQLKDGDITFYFDSFLELADTIKEINYQFDKYKQYLDKKEV